LNLLGLSVSLGWLTYLLGAVSTFVSLYISYNIVLGILELEELLRFSLDGSRLKLMWTVMAVTDVIVLLLYIIPFLGFLVLIAAFVAGLCFLVAFKRTKDLYLEQHPLDGPSV
ncbi:MAG: hypothetical protein AB7C89_09240, partial [Intestinibacillus sp.]